jgi:signal peptidase
MDTPRTTTTRGASRTSPAARSLGFIRELLLNLAAAGGVICVLLVAAALIFDITLVMFKTGSMGPTIPAGAVAVVIEEPAADISIGDVVTVDRPGSLPITHRVTSITDAGGPARVITMKGDANVSEDPAPYTVTSVRRVLFSVPGLAPVIVRMSEPSVMAGITIAVAGLVTWGSWPTNTRQSARPRLRQKEDRGGKGSAHHRTSSTTGRGDI